MRHWGFDAVPTPLARLAGDSTTASTPAVGLPARRRRCRGVGRRGRRAPNEIAAARHWRDVRCEMPELSRGLHCAYAADAMRERAREIDR